MTDAKLKEYFDQAKGEYRYDIFVKEFQETMRKVNEQCTLFVRYLMAVKTLYYVVWWFTAAWTLASQLDAEKLIYDFEIWRLFTAPLVTFSLFNVTVPLYLMVAIGPLESNEGTCYAWIYFHFCSAAVGILKASLYLAAKRLGLAPSFNMNDLWTCLLLVHGVRYLEGRLAREVDLAYAKVPRTAFILALLASCNLFPGYDMLSLVAVALVAYLTLIFEKSPAKRALFNIIRTVESKLGNSA